MKNGERYSLCNIYVDACSSENSSQQQRVLADHLEASLMLQYNHAADISLRHVSHMNLTD